MIHLISSKNLSFIKRFVIGGALMAFCITGSGCKTTHGVRKNKGDLENSGTSVNLKEDSIEYFNNVVKNKIYFSTNRYDLTDEAKSILGSQAAWLKNNNRYAVTVEGHCDERGTREYNLALGERRANMVKRELVKNGVECKRVQTVSYGKERPEVDGSNEEAWAMNRRAVTTLN